MTDRIDRDETEIEIETGTASAAAESADENRPPLPAAMRPADEPAAGVVPVLPPDQSPGLRRPLLWLGTADATDPREIDWAYPRLVDMAQNSARRAGLWTRTWVGWVTGDPADWPGTATAAVPGGMIPADRLAAVVVGAARSGGKHRAPEVWTYLAPLELDDLSLPSVRRVYARTLVTDDQPTADAPPLFSAADAAYMGWIRYAMTGLRILCDVHVNGIHRTPNLPAFYCRTAVTTDAGAVVAGWGPPNTLSLRSTKEDTGVAVADVAYRFSARAEDRLLYEDVEMWRSAPGPWVAVPGFAPWGVIDKPVAGPRGQPLDVQIVDGDCSILIRPGRR